MRFVNRVLTLTFTMTFSVISQAAEKRGLSKFTLDPSSSYRESDFFGVLCFTHIAKRQSGSLC